MAVVRLDKRQLLDLGNHLADAFDFNVLDGREVHLDIGEAGRGQVAKLLEEDALDPFLLAFVDVVPFALRQPGKVLEQAGVPFRADAHDREVGFLLGRLLG